MRCASYAQGLEACMEALNGRDCCCLDADPLEIKTRNNYRKPVKLVLTQRDGAYTLEANYYTEGIVGKQEFKNCNLLSDHLAYEYNLTPAQAAKVADWL